MPSRRAAVIPGEIRYSARAAIRGQVIELLAILEPDLRALASTRPDCEYLRFSGLPWLGRAPEAGRLPECQRRHPACLAWADDVLAWHGARFGFLHDELTFSAIAGLAASAKAIDLYRLHPREATAWAGIPEPSYPGWTSVRLEIHESASAASLRELARDIHAQLKALGLVGQRPSRQGHLDRPARAVLWRLERGLGSSYGECAERWQQRTTAWAGDPDARPRAREPLPPGPSGIDGPAYLEWLVINTKAERRAADRVEAPSGSAVRETILSLQRIEAEAAPGLASEAP